MKIEIIQKLENIFITEEMEKENFLQLLNELKKCYELKQETEFQEKLQKLQQLVKK